MGYSGFLMAGKKKAKSGRKAAASRRNTFKALSRKRRSVAKKAAPKKKSNIKKTSKEAPPKLSKKEEEKRRKAEELMARGRERGFVTYDEILKSFPTIEDDVLFLEELYERFATAKIDVLEGGGMLEVTEESTAYSRTDSGHDSIQMYLREIGKYPLLNTQE